MSPVFTYTTTWVTVPNGDLQISAYLALPQVPISQAPISQAPISQAPISQAPISQALSQAPIAQAPISPEIASAAPRSAVIVIQEVFGVNPYIREVVERLASWGYVAIAPAMYQRTAPGFEVGYSDGELALGRQHKDLTTAAHIESDIAATIQYLRQLGAPEVATGGGLDPDRVEGVALGKIGCIGFCFGGHMAYLAACNPEISATAIAYGSGITSFTPGGGDPSVNRAGEIRGVVWGFFGDRDPLIPNPQVDQLEAALTQHQVPHRLWRYRAGHGFCCPYRPDYVPEAAEQVWQQVQSFYAQTL
jgi:carboxymethylenebutenolidase